MRLIPAIAFTFAIAGCASAPPQPASTNAIAPTFAPPPSGSLVVILPAPRVETLEKGSALAEAQLDAQLTAAGYRVAVLGEHDYQELWSEHASAAGGVFDSVSGTARPQAYSAALSSLARTICDQRKCDLVIHQRLVPRVAKLDGSEAEWDSVRRPIHLTHTSLDTDYRMSGTTAALSLELLALARDGSFAFRRTVGVTLLFETNVKETRNDRRADLFPDHVEVANAVTVALEPLLKGNAPSPR
jgi:hypothetical protein